ncbi:hypothetical protein M2D63_025695, partial [Pseudomonas sp. BJa5]|uniref:hypothetical protein n=1 Tax=Pseudomonas sp. BJa5 TaxID=2936270 RepID=UPI002559E061
GDCRVSVGAAARLRSAVKRPQNLTTPLRQTHRAEPIATAAQSIAGFASSYGRQVIAGYLWELPPGCDQP